MVGAQRCVEERVSRKESGAFHRDDGRRGRRTGRQILSELGADARRKKYSGEIFYAVAGMRALPWGCVQAVEQLGASFFFVQQSVVPEEHRVHAGRRWGEEFEVVRGLPRPGAALQRNVRYADPAD